MADEAKHGTPRWILLLTGLAGLTAAVLVAGTKYYEFHKARADAAKPSAKEDGPSEKVAPSKGNPTSGSAEAGFTAGSVWDGYTDEPIGLKSKIVVESVSNGRFKGIITPHQAGIEWYSAKIEGTISSDGDVEFKTRPQDQFTGQKKLIPCYFRGVVRGNEFRGSWKADTGPSASFVITRK